MVVRILLSAIVLAHLSHASRAGAQEVPFVRVTIDNDPPKRPWYKMAGDVSGDGLVDIVVGGSAGPLVVYVYPDWRKVQIGDGGWNGVNGEIADLDGDGDADIVMGGVVWFENPGSVDRPWPRRRIDTLRAHDIEIADLNGDGRLDVIARDQSAFGNAGNRIHIYRQNGKNRWQRQRIDCPHGEGLKAADLDQDGDTDIVIAGRWYENDRTSAGGWIERRYTNDWKEPDAKVEVADLNGDRLPDIVLTPAELAGETYRVCWFEAPADAKAPHWQEHVIIDSVECVIHALGVADFDGDGDVDLAIAEMHQGNDPDEVSVLLNADQGTRWHKQVLSDRGSHDIVIADIDGDGDPDIVGANHDGIHPLELWRNARVANSAKTPAL